LFDEFRQGFGLAQSEQNLPVFTAPHAQVQPPFGRGLAHSEQNLPIFPVCPQAQVQPPAGAGGHTRFMKLLYIL